MTSIQSTVEVAGKDASESDLPRELQIDAIRCDLELLLIKFKLRYEKSSEKVAADLRGVPPLSGRLIWARQIESRLSSLMRRMETLLGPEGWSSLREGKELREMCDEMRSYLSIDHLFQDWVHFQLRKVKGITPETAVLEVKTDQDQVRILRVAFDSNLVLLMKEVRFLERLLPDMNSNKTIPLTIRTLASQASLHYPVYIAIETTLSSFHKIMLEINPQNETLLAASLSAVRSVISTAMTPETTMITWNSPEILLWVRQFTDAVNDLQDDVSSICRTLRIVECLLEQLSSCKYDENNFLSLYQKLQSIVDNMQSSRYSNVYNWVVSLNVRVADIIQDRLRRAGHAWTVAFTQRFAIEPVEPVLKEDEVIMSQMRHELIIVGQKIILNGTLESSRGFYITHYHNHISILTRIPVVFLSSSDCIRDREQVPLDHSFIMDRFDKESSQKPYLAIEKALSDVRIWCEGWIKYEKLWLIPVARLRDILTEDLTKWTELSENIWSARNDLYRANEEVLFGPLVISSRQLAMKIGARYDFLQAEVQTRLMGLYKSAVEGFSSDFRAFKEEFEKVYLDGSLKDIIGSVPIVTQLKSPIEILESSLTNLLSAQKTLRKECSQCNEEWILLDTMLESFHISKAALSRQVVYLEEHREELLARIQEEGAGLEQRKMLLLSAWEERKQSFNTLQPEEVLQSLKQILVSSRSLEAAQAAALHAAVALKGSSRPPDTRLEELLEEIDAQQISWTVLSASTTALDILSSELFQQSDPVLVRRRLENILADIAILPDSIRFTGFCEQLEKKLSERLAMHLLIRDLHSEVLKERHWRAILSLLDLHVFQGEVTLGMLWKFPLSQMMSKVNTILTCAEGEFAIEKFLTTIRDYWETIDLMVVQRDAVCIIAGWDSILTMMEDHGASLVSMQHSPYFATFEQIHEEVLLWETRITSLRAILLAVVEVQRTWSYLRGIFQNADIMVQLPSQYSTFQSIDSEFCKFIKRVQGYPTCLGLLKHDHLLRQLENWNAAMILIQKSLIDYLDSKRELFPRYYFVNNNDLVEILGSSNQPMRVASHLGGMYSAVVGIQVATLPAGVISGGQSVSHVCSREGEAVELFTPVDGGASPTVWLELLDREVVQTLLSLLQKSMQEFYLTVSELTTWVDHFPAQICLLATQLDWCASCERNFAGLFIKSVLQDIETKLKTLSEKVLVSMSVNLRRKCEQLITELVHQRDVTRILITNKVLSGSAFGWRYNLRVYDKKEEVGSRGLLVQMSNASFKYGFEYQGISERLVQTPLTDRCYFTLTQALYLRMGGCSFGPAGKIVCRSDHLKP